MTPEEHPTNYPAPQGNPLPWAYQYPSAVRVGIPLFLFLSLILLVETIAYQETQHTLTQHHERLRDNAHELRALFENELFMALQLTSGVTSYIQSKKGIITDLDLAPWLANLPEHASHIRNVAIAPKNKVEYVFPPAGNEAAIRLYYPESRDQWPGVKKIMHDHKPMLAGPLMLKQGGKGLIYRAPVFLNNAQYWGLVSTVINFDTLYNALHNRAEELHIRVNVKDLGAGSVILFGDSIDQAQHQEALNIPGRQWLLLLESKNPVDLTVAYYLRVSGWLLALFFSGLIFKLLQSFQRHQKIQTDLHHSETRFSQIVNAAPQGIALVAFTGEIRHCNQSLANILGYSSHELLKKNFFEVAAPAHRERISHLLQGINPLNASYQQYESILIDKYENPINVILSLSPTTPTVYESDWIIQTIDISYRVSFEHRLQEEAQYRHTLVDKLLDSVLIINEMGQVVDANLAASKLFDVNSPQLLRQYHINQLIQYPTSGKTLDHISLQANKHLLNSDLPQELMGITAAGSMFHADVLISTGHRKKESVYILVIRDINERRRIEKLKQDILSSISHELRTPLTAIAAGLKLLHSGKIEGFSEPANKIITIAEQNCKRLHRLANELLDLHKLQSGKLHLNLSTQSLATVLESSLKELSTYFDSYSTKVSAPTISPSIYVHVDTDRLQQAFSNLLTNAIKHSPPQGVVRINTRILSNRVRIEVIDQGEGIAPDAQANIFQKFYQIENNEIPKATGAGIGLSIAKELVTAMQGNIGVESTLGKGCCFYIELPMTNYQELSETA